MNQSSVFWARVVFALLFVIVTWLTITPNPDDTKTGFKALRWIASFLFGDATRADKIAHFSAYGVLGVSGFFANITLFGEKRWIPFGLAIYGVLLEGVQGLGGIRSPEAMDALANALGAVVGFAGGYMVTWMFQGEKA